MFLLLAFGMLFAQTCFLSPDAKAQANDTPKRVNVAPHKRLKIGLVLSGGGSRGIAHVGVIEWFEKNRIPVDYIAGTSMGGLIGGVYSMGMKPEDMRSFLKSLNWDDLMSSGPDFDQLAFRRKEDQRSFQVGLKLGYRNGLSLPLGISSAHYIGLLIDRLTLPYSGIKSFDELPIPYRCVATDFIAAKPLVLKDGSLASAMRATMSIPGVFPPVEREGTLLVDGALLNNIPTDVIKELKPDVIIAIDVGTQLSNYQNIVSLAGILQQSITVMTIDNDRRNLRLADIIIAPELGELSVLDFSSIDKVADLGYQAAAAKAAILEKFALNHDDWKDYLANRRAQQRTTLPVPDMLEITGVNDQAEKYLLKELHSYAGQPLKTKRLEDTLTRIAGRGRYESLGYGLTAGPSNPGKNILDISVREKTYAPPAINLGIEIDGSEVNQINFTVGARVTFYGVGDYRAEWRNDFKLGFGNLFQTEYFRPVGEGGFFIAPRAMYRRERQDVFTGRTRVAEYQANKYGAGFDLGYLRERSELRVGYEHSRINARASTGLPDLLAIDGNISLARVRFTFDGQDSPTIPKHGLRFVAEGRYYIAAPDAESKFPQAEIRGSYFRSMSNKGSIFGALSGGTSFNKTAPAIQEFLLGGPFRFGAYDRDELRVDHYFLATAGYLHHFYQLPSLVGGSIYGGAWFDQMGTFGGFTSNFDSQRYRAALSAGFVMDTKIGPFSLVGSYGEGGRGKIYFALGRFF
jgi:NTE family protein